MALPGILASALSYVSLLLILYGVLLCIYRTLLHPLQKYPGPFLAKMSDIHNGYFAMRKCLHLVSKDDHLKYGPVIRHGPNKLLFNTVKALHDIYDNDMAVKSYVYSVFVQTPGVFSLFSVVEKQQHRIKRKIIGEVINERSMRMFEPTMIKQIDVYLKLLRNSSEGLDSQPVNMTEMLEFMVKGMYAANHWTNTRMHFFALHQMGLSSVMRWLNRSNFGRYRKLLEKMIMARIAKKDETHDLYSIVSRANSEAVSQDDRIQMSEIWSEGISFFPAGAFSTSGALSALFFYLSQSPTCYRKLANEVRSTFTTGDEIRNGTKLSSCRYLRVCIDEALRVAPPVPGTMWREPSSTNSKSLIVDGYFIPPGTQIGVNIYAIHHNREYFPDPFAFKPERWLPETPEAQRKMMRDAFSPFSLGYRGCAGKAMAYLESSLVVAKTLWYFDFHRASGKLGRLGGGNPGRTDGRDRPDEYQLYDIISGAHDGPFLVFKPRVDVSMI
ncbi:cytochrome P450 [Whalleya microplaca]|nr:cytochrome P450 [Whalleya microplaca]